MLTPFMACNRWMLAVLVIVGAPHLHGAALGQANAFSQGNAAYAAGHFGEAAQQFAAEIQRAPSAEAWRNLGNAEWQEGHHGLAVLDWERAVWINPFDMEAATSLRFARGSAGLSAPPLRWWEALAIGLPPDVWIGLATAGLWLALGTAVIFPVTLRWRRSAWNQALAAFGLGVSLVAFTAAYGVQTRMRLAVITTPAAPVLQAPAAHAPVVLKLNEGDVARTEFTRGNYYHVRTGAGDAGWLEKSQLQRITRP